jgi:hypothetical protein
MARLDDAILMSKPVLTALLHRFHDEASLEDGNGQFYALIHQADGKFMGFNPGSPELKGDQEIFATDLLRFLNREIHHDGAWAMAFTHPEFNAIMQDGVEYKRFLLLWLDKDGDVQLPLDWVHGESDDLFDFTEVMMAGLEMWATFAEESWHLWHRAMVQIMAPKANQLIKAAQGQQARA